MPWTSRRLRDAATLKALAHPLRMDLLEQLVLTGPRTATELAAVLGESPSNCSWHLRKLAEHGYVEEVPDVPGRNRPWRASSEGLSWGEPEGGAQPDSRGDEEAAGRDAEGPEDAEARAAGHALTEMLVQRELARLREAWAAEPDEPPEWRAAGGLTQSALWLTAQEAREVSDRIRELLLSRIERTKDPSLRPPGARLVSLVAWLAPRPDSPPAHETDEPGDSPR